MQKCNKKGFLLLEAVVALLVLTIFLGGMGAQIRASWQLFRMSRHRMQVLERVIEIVERGNGGRVMLLSGERGLPDCRYRLVEVDGVWVCARI